MLTLTIWSLQYTKSEQSNNEEWLIISFFHYYKHRVQVGIYIEKFNSLYNEWAHLEEIQDFSQRYQTLKDIFISPNYKNEFYHFDPSDDVLDLFAEKVASKIMKKLEKGS